MAMAVVAGSFDDLRSRDIRFLQEAAKLGELNVQLWSDQMVEALDGKAPKFPQAERLYFIEALRYVKRVTIVDGPFGRDGLLTSTGDFHSGINITWAVDQGSDNPAKQQFAENHRIKYQVISDEQLQGFPMPALSTQPTGKPKVIVTGCYDWVHTGHVRFFEEASEHGDLYVVAGHDKNIELLKGKGRPLFPAAERKYIVQSIRFVQEALISSGDGWLDAQPEIERIRPDKYIVNEDGDRPEKQDYCKTHGIEYMVLQRLPKPGLTKRSSTDLRGY
jgi:cytidyltransferase-like protein